MGNIKGRLKGKNKKVVLNFNRRLFYILVFHRRKDIKNLTNLDLSA